MTKTTDDFLNEATITNTYGRIEDDKGAWDRKTMAMRHMVEVHDALTQLHIWYKNKKDTKRAKVFEKAVAASLKLQNQVHSTR